MANERMINTVSVGIVYVAGPGQYALSTAEKAHILAEVQEGLEALAANEPRANLSWGYSTLSVNLPTFVAWEGANWPGLTEPFYRGMSDALWSGTTQKIYFFQEASTSASTRTTAGRPIRAIPSPLPATGRVFPRLSPTALMRRCGAAPLRRFTSSKAINTSGSTRTTAGTSTPDIRSLSPAIGPAFRRTSPTASMQPCGAARR